MDTSPPSVASPALTQKPVTNNNRVSWWRRLAYRHKAAELSLYILFLTGLPLWSLFNLSWEGERLLLLAHCLGGLMLFPLLILPFWLSHRRLWENSRNQRLRRTGRYLDLLMLLCTLSGIYLLLLGNRGEWLGNFSHYLHLISALPLTLFLLRHAARWSVLRPFSCLIARLFIRR